MCTVTYRNQYNPYRNTTYNKNTPFFESVNIIVFVWSRNDGTNRTKGFLAPEMNIVGGATC